MGTDAAKLIPSGSGRPTLGGIVLAGGASRRLGRSKLLLDLAGRTVLARSVDPLLGQGLDRVVVVLGDDAERVWTDAGAGPDPTLRYVVNTGWPEGQASSLRCGVRACADCDAVIVTLGDLPGLRRDQVARVIETWDGRAPAVAAVHEGRWQHPVLFARALYEDLLRLQGDVGGRSVLAAHADRVVKVHGEPLQDVDTEADYLALLAQEGPRRQA